MLGADINAQTEETQETALTLACCGGFLEVADFLIKVNKSLNLFWRKKMDHVSTPYKICLKICISMFWETTRDKLEIK